MLDYVFGSLSLGIVVILISAFGYISNFLNGKFLNFKITHLLFYIGAFVHETSHALLALVMGAKIIEYKVLVQQPRVVYAKPKIPFLGDVLISFAPVAGGLLFLFLVNRYLLHGQFILPSLHQLSDIFSGASKLLRQLNFFQWQTWMAFFLCLNIGSMVGPSARDLKNIWPLLILLLFVNIPFIISLGLLALLLIVVNIIIQLVLIIIFKIIPLHGS